MTTFLPSPYQRAIFAFIEGERSSLIINAVAGSGKTTTILEALKLPKVASSRSVLFLAFNRSIAEELKSRVPAGVRAATFHSLGYGAWMKYRGGKNKVQVDDKKVSKIVERLFSEAEVEVYGPTVRRLVGLAKGEGIGYLKDDAERVWYDIADHHCIYPETENSTLERAVEMAREALKASWLDEATIDYDDMLYMPLRKELRFWQNDFVFVDETQDLNAVQIALLRRTLLRTGRLIAVGDRAQAIYGFRGADSSAMDRVKATFRATELPLSVCYRCATSIVEAAAAVRPGILPAPNAPQGSVLYGQSLDLETLGRDTAILCRNVAPMVEVAYGLIARGIAATIRGRDIGLGLVVLVRKMRAKTADKLEERLEAYEGRMRDKLIAKGKEDEADAVSDRVRAVLAILGALPENNRTISALIEQIERMFSDDNAGAVVLSTVHKAKGLEWERVYILRPDLMPGKFARQPWQVEQEHNLMYVAYTRARQELMFLTPGSEISEKSQAKAA